MNYWKYVLGGLSAVFVLILFIVLETPDSNLRIIACDVGQGDAFLITHKNTQVLIDAGKGRKVLDCLGRHLPFWDRKVEMIVITHPQFDHYGGFIDVLSAYDVESVMVSELKSSAGEYGVLENLIVSSQARIIRPEETAKIRYGLIYLDIVHPDSEFFDKFSQKTKKLGTNSAENSENSILGMRETDRDPNDFSVVMNLSFGEFEALFTGDIGPSVISEVISSGELHGVEYLKVPHHGSKNGLTEELLEILDPEISAIGVGKNSFGHPHTEVIRMLNESGSKIFRTDMDGDIVVVTDGEAFWVEK